MFQDMLSIIVLACLILAQGYYGIVIQSTEQHVFFEEVQKGYKSEGKYVIVFLEDLNYLDTYFKQIEGNLIDVRRLSYAAKSTFAARKDRQESYVSAFHEVFWNARDLLELIRSKYTTFHNTVGSFDTRRRRALLPLGNFFKFLIGVSSETDVQNLKEQVDNLARSQKSVIHAVEKSMSILNLTNSEISENRNAINELIATARSINLRITNTTQDILQILLPLHKFLTAYIHIKSCFEETEFLAQRFLLHLETVYSKLDILLLGRLSVEIISPLTLHNTLIDIANSLPEGTKLLVDPSRNIWHYFKSLPCTTMIHNMRLHLTCTVSLVNIKDEGSIVLVHNLPIRTRESSLLMEIETESLVIYGNEFSFLPHDSPCSQQPADSSSDSCIVSGLPRYVIDENIPCPVALYFNKVDLAKKVCPVKVSSGHSFPYVKKIGQQRWAISLKSNINMHIACTDRANETVSLKPPLVVFKLPNSCEAFGPTFKISMEPVFTKSSNINDHDILNVKFINNSFVWEDGRDLDALRDKLKEKIPR